MNRSLTKAQKDKVSQFVSITGSSQKIALDCLQIADWRVEAAIDYFFSSGLQYVERQATRIDRAALDKFFATYKDTDNDAILVDGIVSLCDDVGVEPEDIIMLVLSYHLNAAGMGEYTRDEFIQGMTKLGCDSVDKLKQKIPSLRKELDDPDKFREIYNYAYTFGREKGQKIIMLDMALGLWQLLISPERWAYIEDWCEFIKTEHGRAVSRDTWSQLLDFMGSVSDFNNYDDTSAWPYLMDEFVSWKKKKEVAENGTDN